MITIQENLDIVVVAWRVKLRNLVEICLLLLQKIGIRKTLPKDYKPYNKKVCKCQNAKKKVIVSTKDPLKILARYSIDHQRKERY